MRCLGFFLCLFFVANSHAAGVLTIQPLYSLKFSRLYPSVALYVREKVSKKTFYTSWSGYTGYRYEKVVNSDDENSQSYSLTSIHQMGYQINSKFAVMGGGGFNLNQERVEPLLRASFSVKLW